MVGRKKKETYMTEASEFDTAPAAGVDTNSPEFQKAVAEAVAGAIPALKDQILSHLAEARGAAPAASEGTADHAFANALAMSLAQLTDQGTGRKRVAPEILRARSEHRDCMTTLIIDARASGLIPVYSLKNKCYLDEVMIEPFYIAPDHTQRPTEIEWLGVPNEAMSPVNDIAQKIHAEFVGSIGSVAKDDNLPERELKVTPGGVVVKGRPMGRNTAKNSVNQPAATSEGLRVRHKDAPGQFKETHILGTVAAPARQTA